MAWMQCRSCSTKFAVGLLRCPQCEAVSELFAVPEEVIEAEQEAKASMPKISVAEGPSNALGQPVEPEAAAAETAELALPVESETSDETSATTDEAPGGNEGATEAVESESAPAPKPARKTAAKKAAAKAESAPAG